MRLPCASACLSFCLLALLPGPSTCSYQLETIDYFNRHRDAQSSRPTVMLHPTDSFSASNMGIVKYWISQAGPKDT